MGNGRRYSKEQITFVLGLLVQNKPRQAIVQAFHERFNANGQLGFPFGLKQVKYIKQGYGKHPDYGHPFLTQQDTERYSNQVARGNSSSSKKDDDDYDDDEDDDDMAPHGEVLRASASEALVPPMSAGGFNAPLSPRPSASQYTGIGLTTATRVPTGEQSPWLLTRPANLNLPVATRSSQTFGDAGTGQQAARAPGYLTDAGPGPQLHRRSPSQESPSDIARNRRVARTTGLGVAGSSAGRPDPSSFRAQVTLPSGTWLKSHHRCPITRAHRHQPDGSVTFRTMDDFLRTHHELRGVATPILDRAVRDTIDDIAQRVAAIHGQESALRQPGTFATTLSSGENSRAPANAFGTFASSYPPIPGANDRAVNAGTASHANRFVAINTPSADTLGPNRGMPAQPSS